MIERIGRVGHAPERLVYRDLKLERKGFLSLFSFALESSSHRFDGMARGPAVVVLPADFARRELYMLHEIRPLKPFAHIAGPRETLSTLLEGAEVARCETSSDQARLYEMPAGMIDGDETPEEAAVRELREETGLIIPTRCLRRVASVFPSIGGSTEFVHLFIADLPETHAQDRGEALGDGGEEIEILKMGWDDAFALLETETMGVSSGLLLRELKILDMGRGVR
ncbi:MAG: NUDIX domain-containing protein [Patescibacteria group bacterium]|nr:MAG: NUDIX domain-containing protein [Patescibacteria group bacterium]